LAQRRAAQATYDAATAQYKQTVLTAFQNVADTLAALEHDAQALDAANFAARAAQGIADETAARYRLGAVPVSAARSSEQQFRNARLDEIRYTGARLTDTAALFQAMGTPPVEATGNAGATGASRATPPLSSTAPATAPNATTAAGQVNGVTRD
jgi:outer membrane protein TolC